MAATAIMLLSWAKKKWSHWIHKCTVTPGDKVTARSKCFL